MRTRGLLVTIASAFALAACSTDMMTSSNDALTVRSVSPASGATAVSLGASVVVTFSQSMMLGMEMNVLLHQDTVTGPTVAGTSTWSADRTTLTFTPSAPLNPATTYVLHLAPTMMSSSGQQVNHAACTSLGGQNVTSGMMGTTSGGMMGGSTSGSGMMGSGWQMANGSYGMVFKFKTA